MPRKSLSDILQGDARARLQQAWDSAKPADEFTPLPKGEYVSMLESTESFQAKTGTAGFKLTFRITEGEYAGRRCWYDVWLTEAAASMAKTDLGKLGIHRVEQLDQPTPQGIVCRIKVVVRESDDGDQYNRVKWFDVDHIEPPAPDPFAPSSAGEHRADAEHQDGDESEGGNPQ
ncbi:MAG TPA: DUF669 domain-containing protein [Pirellulales bacterium]|nr:DUF669 domain-containing protein [Pirellulales bacterium]